MRLGRTPADGAQGVLPDGLPGRGGQGRAILPFARKGPPKDPFHRPAPLQKLQIPVAGHLRNGKPVGDLGHRNVSLAFNDFKDGFPPLAVFHGHLPSKCYFYNMKMFFIPDLNCY
jgi:hypothetical protein